MAVILKQYVNVAGYNVALSVGGKPVTLTFRSQPSDAVRDEAIRAFEERLLREIQVGGEENDVLSQRI